MHQVANVSLKTDLMKLDPLPINTGGRDSTKGGGGGGESTVSEIAMLLFFSECNFCFCFGPGLSCFRGFQLMNEIK